MNHYAGTKERKGEESHLLLAEQMEKRAACKYERSSG